MSAADYSTIGEGTVMEPEKAGVDNVEFVRVARSGQVTEGLVRRFFSGEHEFAIARLDGKAYATSNYCTHLDCLLSSGKLVEDGIGCSCHGSVFDLETGEPVYPPATVAIKTYAVEEREGEIFVGFDPSDTTSVPRRRATRGLT